MSASTRTIEDPRVDARAPEVRPPVDDQAESGRLRAAFGAALSVGSAVGALRTLVRLVKLGKLGPLGLAIAAGQAAISAVAAAKAIRRWRAARRERRRQPATVSGSGWAATG